MNRLRKISAQRAEFKSWIGERRESATQDESFDDLLAQVKRESAPARNRMRQRTIAMKQAHAKTLVVAKQIAEVSQANAVARERSRAAMLERQVEARIMSLMSEKEITMQEFADMSSHANATVNTPLRPKSGVVIRRLAQVHTEARKDEYEERQERKSRMRM